MMPTSQVMQRLKQAVNRQRLVETVVRLVEVPSRTGEAEAATDRLRQLLAADGFLVERPEGGHPQAPAVAVRLEGKRPGRTLQFNGHLDTVHLPFVPPNVRDGKITGSGASDMKGGLAAAVESRELPPPVALPRPRDHLGLAVLGVTTFRARREPFGILPEDRLRHIAILGKTGMGKSTLLRNLIASDIEAGRGIALIDPHGDLVEAVLQTIPRRRTNEVVLFDAGEKEHPLSFNVLTCRRREERPLVTSGIVSAFKKLYAESWGPRLEHILRNAILALLEVPGTTLGSVLRLLGDTAYRKTIIPKIDDAVVRSFWEHEFTKMQPKLQAEAIAPIQIKVGHFVSSPLLRNIVGQTRSSLDLRRVMDEGNVLLVNLSKGRIGDDASTLLGSLLVSSLQIAAMGRADIPEERRRDFFLYVDEFQNFATESFATILSEARKYRLALTIANQYLAQMEEEAAAAVFGNVGTLITFQVGAQDAEILAEQLGRDVTTQDLLTVPRYHAYIRLLISGQPSRPFSMQTLPPPRRPADPDRPEVIRRYSRQRYARPAEKVEQEIRNALASA